MAIPMEEFRSRWATAKGMFAHREYERWYFKRCAKIVARWIDRIPYRILKRGTYYRYRSYPERF